MKKKPLYSGQDKHPANPLWIEEVQKTSEIPGWKENLLTRVNATLSSFGGRILKKIGFRIDEVQLQYDAPILAFFSFLSQDDPEKVAWVQFRTWDPFTKKPGTRTLRFSPETACLMVLVRSPHQDGSYDWYLLARKKYQFGVQEHFIEFSRGWLPDIPASQAGWFLLDRDYPGLRNLAKKINHRQLDEVWENTAEFTNKISYHVIVVTLDKPLNKEQLKKLLVKERLKKEWEEGYDQLDETDLVQEPKVFDLEEAASLLNSHLVGNAKKPLFGENYSLSCWSRFLAICGKRFPHLLPDECFLSE